ncbi:hypothetical protein [Sphingosinicella rhizophila]|uniref:Uncharacterized protein n=1 Tax=Sphingosinicella rhizophila TaxID=3050082 RepID=A0ABU3Q994_9SPHN|nr:hypothetical protein [Sphingosinicella sp. GR2756]MDT9599941.1 hypothetical protein [Sphingosinicella sp. GR2756]
MPNLGTNEHVAIDRLALMAGSDGAWASPVAAYYFSSFIAAHRGAVRTDAI